MYTECNATYITISPLSSSNLVDLDVFSDFSKSSVDAIVSRADDVKSTNSTVSTSTASTDEIVSHM